MSEFFTMTFVQWVISFGIEPEHLYLVRIVGFLVLLGLLLAWGRIVGVKLLFFLGFGVLCALAGWMIIDASPLWQCLALGGGLAFVLWLLLRIVT